MQIQDLHRLFLESNGVCTDTRKITNNSLFFALKGPNFDANQFAATALEQGCAYAIVDDKEISQQSNNIILVDDVLITLQELANFHRNTFNIPIIGITGSNGKTTNKELLHQVLSKKYNTLATIGNLNNHIGVPLTLLRLNKAHEIAIIEMGANHVGDIKELTTIAEPNFGFITSIGVAHLEGFGSVEGIKRGKKELFDHLNNNDGKSFVNLADEVVTSLYQGKSEDAIFYGDEKHLPSAKILATQPSLSIECKVASKNYTVNSQLIGNFQVNNLLNAFAIGQYFEVPNADIVDALEAYHPKNNRAQRKAWNNNQLILDAYNANPTSMEAAIDGFLKYETSGKLAVLGDMLELGDESLHYHQQLVEKVDNNLIEKVVLVGDEFSRTNYPEHFHVFSSTKEASIWFEAQNFKDKTILVKGSRGIGLEKIFN